ncbi:FG-GAP repeat domain-containing protein, partial [Nevskia soli]|uniref:FG-GAP repeat domain-containing protein n=1 Tax=Nevskia soli TaxID=418856 RepID=UPI0015D692C3
MSRKQISVSIFFLALLGTPLVYKRLNARTQVRERSADPAVALARYGLSFHEAARESGIDFKHTSPHLDAKLNHIMEQVASMGAAVSIVDYDRDGLADIYVINSGEGSKNALYHNLGNGRFEDVADQLGLADVNQSGTGVSTGAVWGDYDNDGYEDVLIYKWGKPELFHNDGGKHFTRVTEQAGL